MKTSFVKEYKAAKKKDQVYEDMIKLLQTGKDNYLVIRKRDKNVYLRRGVYEGRLISYLNINRYSIAVLYLNRNFKVKYEVLPKKAFDIFLEKEDHGPFFKIKNEIYGFGRNEKLFVSTQWWNNDSKPSWYRKQEFKELTEMVIDDPEEKAFLLKLADERE